MKEKLDKYINGIDFMNMMKGIQTKLNLMRESTLKAETEEIERADFFYLNKLKEQQEVLGELLETKRLPAEKKCMDVDETATFLTQVYKES